MPLRSFTPAEIVVTERRRLERPLLVLIWLSVCSFALAEGNAFYLLAGTFGVGLNLAASWRAKEVYVARLFVNISVLAATIILMLELTSIAAQPTVAMAHWIILILLCKLFERKSNRDYVQMLCLSLLVIVAAAMMTQGLWYAAALAIYLLLACHVGMVFTLKRGLDKAAGAVLASEPGPMAPHQVAWNVVRDWPRRAIRRKIIFVATMAACMAVCSFLLPRWSHGGSGRLSLEPSRSREVGLPRELTLGEPSQVYLSDKVLMRVRISGPGRKGSMGSGYMRAATFEQYFENRWIPSPGSAVASQAPVPPAGDRIVQEISVDPSISPAAPTMYPAVQVQSGSGRNQPACDRYLNWVLPNPGRKWRQYTAATWAGPLNQSQRDYLRGLCSGPQVDQQPGGYLDPDAAPSITVAATPFVQAMAREWCKDLLIQRERAPGDRDRLDRAIADRIASNLKRDYVYSLDFRDADPDSDGVEDFLFRMKHGHCEYFASAMTVMCRSLDVRARLAIGFKFDQDNLKGDTYLVRSRDAHAWTEIYTPGTDWVVVDATGGRRGNVPRGGAMSWIARFWSGLEDRWSESVIGYDAQTHRRLATGVQRLLASAWRMVESWGHALGRSFTNLLLRGQIDAALVRLNVVLAVLACGIAGLLFVRRVRSRGDHGFGSLPASQVEFFARLQVLFDRLGLKLRQGQTFREQAVAAQLALGLGPTELCKLVDLYYLLRWGQGRIEDQRLQEASTSVDLLERQLKDARHSSQLIS